MVVISHDSSDEDLLAFYHYVVGQLRGKLDDPDRHVFPESDPSPETLRRAFTECWPGEVAESMADEKAMAESTTGARGSDRVSAARAAHPGGRGWHHEFLHQCGIKHGR
jgi:hypothetical protein